MMMIFNRYANYCGLEKPCDDVSVVLDKTSQRIGAIRQGKLYNYNSSKLVSCLF